MTVLQHFAPGLSERIWDWVQGRMVGASLTPHKRTVSRVLRMIGLSGERQFQNDHRVLNRACWSGLEASRIWLGLLVSAFVPVGSPIIVAADETLERRRGKCLGAKGHFRDPVLSSEKHRIASEGLRWVRMMRLVKVPWSNRVWAVPFLTWLAPHEKTNHAMGKRHTTAIDWVQQMTSQVRRWWRQPALILRTDGGLIAVRLGLRCKQYAHAGTFVAPLHLNIRRFDPPVPSPGQNASPVGHRQPTLQARLTDPDPLWTRQPIRWSGGKQRRVEGVTATGLWQTPVRKNPRCRSAGCWCVTRWASSKLRPLAAPI